MARRISAREAPGTLREYESIVILRPDSMDTGIESVNTRMRDIILDMGGKLTRLENWGRRRLAYPIRKQQKGIYLYWQYLAAADTVQELGRNLRLMDTVLRYFTVKLDENIDPNARPSDVDDDAFAAASRIAVEEEPAVSETGYPHETSEPATEAGPVAETEPVSAASDEAAEHDEDTGGEGDTTSDGGPAENESDAEPEPEKEQAEPDGESPEKKDE